MPSAGWLEAMNAPDLGIAIAGETYAATQTMDEEHRQVINYNGAFGSKGPVTRSVRKADEASVSMSAILLKPGQEAGWDDEKLLLGQDDFKIVCRRGGLNGQGRFYVYDHCAWNTVHVASTLEQVTLTADFSVPGYEPPTQGSGSTGG